MHFILKKRIKLIRAMVDAYNKLVAEHSTTREDLDSLHSIITQIRKDDLNHFLSMANQDSTKISYAKEADNRLVITKRIVQTLPRYIRRHYTNDAAKLNGSDTGLNNFVRFVDMFINKSQLSELDKRIVFLSGEDITRFYRTTETRSCMSGSCNSYKTKLYEQNSYRVQLVVLDNMMRALLWTCDDGTKLFDRIYPSGHHLIPLFRMWAESKNYVLRKNPDQNVVDHTIELLDGSHKKVTLQHTQLFPFMDTFRYGEVKGKTIILSNDFEFGNVMLSSDQGIYNERMRCEKCRERHAKKYSVIIDGAVTNVILCDNCYNAMFGSCHNCGQMPKADIAINSESNRSRKSYCFKCANQYRNFLLYNKCSCDNCMESKQHYEDVFTQSKIDIHDDSFFLRDKDLPITKLIASNG